MPVTQFVTAEKYQYLNGFQSYHELVCPLIKSSVVYIRVETSVN